ncbi:MAG: hypothetical protein WDA01_12120, partial [Methanothrix sp.]
IYSDVSIYSEVPENSIGRITKFKLALVKTLLNLLPPNKGLGESFAGGLSKPPLVRRLASQEMRGSARKLALKDRAERPS